MEIYQGQPPTAQSHTARPEYNPALTHLTDELGSYNDSVLLVCVCVFLHMQKHAHSRASICGHERGRTQMADAKLNGGTVAFVLGDRWLVTDHCLHKVFNES